MNNTHRNNYFIDNSELNMNDPWKIPIPKTV